MTISPHTQKLPSPPPPPNRYALGRPLARRGVVPRAVGAVELRNLRHERVVRVGVRQEGADGEEHLGDGQRWAPLVLEDVLCV